jgi:hypothetical protein
MWTVDVDVDGYRQQAEGVMPHDEQPHQTAGTGRGERL